MKLLYITLWDFKDGLADGVVKKIRQHIQVMKENGIEVDFTTYSRNNYKIYLNESTILGECKGIIKGISARKIILEYITKNKYDGVYFRHPGRIDRQVIEILKVAKNQHCKIVYEIPTYPYDGEIRGIRDKVDLFIDRIYRKKLKLYVDKIAAFSTEKKIYGIDVIYLTNGIDVCSILFDEKKDVNEIHMIAVAKFSESHGYDRMIHALGKYNLLNEKNKRQILFHLIGDGLETEKYKKLVYENKLTETVIFYGMKSGNELNNIFKKCNIAVDCLGLHRFGLEKVSSLKSLEYLAKGLPIIHTGLLNKIEEESNIWCKISNDESEINIDEIIKFFDEIYKDPLINFKIREFAQNSYDMKVVFKDVISFFMQNRSENEKNGNI